MKAALLFVLMAVLCGCSSVKSFDELSDTQINALQESNQRLDVYDKHLLKLDQELAKGKIHRKDYDKQTAELTALIREESEFQNAILVKDPKIKVMAGNLLDDIQKAAATLPTVVEVIGVAVLKGFAGSSTTISP